ncbi:MAG: hypothetical protein ACT4QC_04930 [Planctomycetaceae bacterium]
MWRRLLLATSLFDLLPWWGAVGVLLALAAGFYVAAKYLFHRMHREIVQSVVEQGAPLADALVSVHSAEPAEVPSEPAFDDDPDNENYNPDLDGNLTADEVDYYGIGATIAPEDPTAEWHPEALSLVSADFEPQEELEATDQTDLLHTVEILRGRKFARLRNESVAGAQRLRMLFAVTKRLREAKFACHFNYFGRVTLPAGVLMPG